MAHIDSFHPDTDAILRAAGFAPSRIHARYTLPLEMSAEQRRHVQEEALTTLITDGHTASCLTLSGPSQAGTPAHSTDPDVDRVLSWTVGVAAQIPGLWVCAAEFGLSDDDRADIADRAWSAHPVLAAEHIPAATASFYHLKNDVRTIALPSADAALGFTLATRIPFAVLGDAPFAAHCAPSVLRAPANPADGAWAINDLYLPVQQAARRAYTEHARRYAEEHVGRIPLTVHLESTGHLIVETSDETPDWIRSAISRSKCEQVTHNSFAFECSGPDDVSAAIAALRDVGVPAGDLPIGTPKTNRLPAARKHGPTGPGKPTPPTPPTRGR